MTTITTAEEPVEVPYKFDPDNEEAMRELADAVEKRAKYALRQVIGMTLRFRERVSTGRFSEYGDELQDWDKVSTKELINFYSEASAWCFYSTPVKLRAFIESSLAEIVYNDVFNKALVDPSNTGTVAAKKSAAEMKTVDSAFVTAYRKMYTEYVTETLKTFDSLVRRLERVINMRQQEERMNPNATPFKD
jgi:hypothetical protein